MSLLIYPGLVGGQTEHSVNAPDLASPDGVIALRLQHAETLKGDAVWLRYDVSKSLPSKTVKSAVLTLSTMKTGNMILKFIALLSLALLLAAVADSQMNRDDPFLGSKLPKMTDDSIFSKVKMSSSSVVISRTHEPSRTSGFDRNPGSGEHNLQPGCIFCDSHS